MSIEIGNKRKDWHDSLLMAGVNISTIDDHEIVAAITGKSVYIYRIWLRVDAANDITLKSEGTALDGMGTIDYGTSGEFTYEDSSGQFPIKFPEGQNAEISLSAAQKLSGLVWYAQF